MQHALSILARSSGPEIVANEREMAVRFIVRFQQREYTEIRGIATDLDETG